MNCCKTAQTETGAAACAAPAAEKTAATFRPSVDIFEGADEFVIRADLPGARADAIDVRVDDGVLRFRAAVATRPPAGARQIVGEYGVGDFERSFRLGDGIDTERINAEFKDGVLTLRVPKAAVLKPRSVPVRAA